MTTLITGATGFVGAAVLRELLREGHSVRALTRPTSNLKNLEGLSVERVVGDLTDRPSLDRALKGCRYLFHVAADYRLWTPRPEEIYRNNVEGTRSILEAAAEAGVERIVYTSSVATLGRKADASPADETTTAKLDEMTGHYKKSKFLAEEEVRRLAAAHSLNIIIVNPSTPVGPGDIRPTPTGRMIRDAVRGRIPAWIETGLNIVHVDDVARGHLMAFEKGKPGERYILGGENMTLETILVEISRLTGHARPRIRLSPSVVLPLAYLAETWARLRGSGEPLLTVDGVKLARHFMYFSSSRAERDLGYTHRPAALAIGDAVRWFNQNRVNCHF